MESQITNFSSLMTIPNELRNQIFELVAESCDSLKIDIETLDFIRHQSDQNAEFTIARRIQHGSPGILFACKKTMSGMLPKCLAKARMQIRDNDELRKVQMLSLRSSIVAFYLDLIRQIDFIATADWSDSRGRAQPHAIATTFTKLAAVFPQAHTLAITIAHHNLSCFSMIRAAVTDWAPTDLQQVTVHYTEGEVRVQRLLASRRHRMTRAQAQHESLFSVHPLLRAETGFFWRAVPETSIWLDEMDLMRVTLLNEQLALTLAAKKAGREKEKEEEGKQLVVA